MPQPRTVRRGPSGGAQTCFGVVFCEPLRCERGSFDVSPDEYLAVTPTNGPSGLSWRLATVWHAFSSPSESGSRGRASVGGVETSAPCNNGPHHNHARSALRGACSAVRWPFLFVATDLLRYWCGRASADGMGRSVPRVGPHHNHAPRPKSALRGARCAGGRPILHGMKRSRDASHGV